MLLSFLFGLYSEQILPPQIEHRSHSEFSRLVQAVRRTSSSRQIRALDNQTLPDNASDKSDIRPRFTQSKCFRGKIPCRFFYTLEYFSVCYRRGGSGVGFLLCADGAHPQAFLKARVKVDWSEKSYFNMYS